MKLIIQQSGEVIDVFTQEELKEKQNYLAEKYNKKQIESYILTFKEGVEVEKTHNINNITPEMLDIITLKLR